MLNGPHLSPVQSYGSVVLDTIELVEKSKRRDFELRAALLSSGLVSDPADLFEEFRDVVTDDAAEIDEGTDVDGDAVATKWDFSNAQMERSQEEVEREIAAMLAAASSGTANFEEPTYSDWI